MEKTTLGETPQIVIENVKITITTKSGEINAIFIRKEKIDNLLKEPIINDLFEQI